MSATFTFPGESTTRKVELALLSDDELVDFAYEVVQTFDDPDSSTLYHLFGEAFERWAPESEWRNMVNRQVESESDPAQLRRELEASREHTMERASLRLSRLPLADGGAS
jgi:hypothetical protein